MSERPQQQADLAGMAGAIERLAGDLALAEEPARFIAALECPRKPSLPETERPG